MKRAGKGFIYTVLVLLLLVVMGALLIPAIFESRLAVVLSGSMEPTLPTGSLAIMDPVDPQDIRVGDIIVFEPPMGKSNTTVSHRVLDIQHNGFVTKGDANEEADPYIIPPENVTDKVIWHIPRIGYAVEDLKELASTIWGLVLLIVLPALLIFIGAIQDARVMMTSSYRRIRLQKKAS